MDRKDVSTSSVEPIPSSEFLDARRTGDKLASVLDSVDIQLVASRAVRARDGRGPGPQCGHPVQLGWRDVAVGRNELGLEAGKI